VIAFTTTKDTYSYLPAATGVKDKEGYRLVMALSAFCTVCQRTVYIEDGETPVCPVCSSPLLETVEGNGAPAQEEKR
jgi:hypothetical protein